MNNSGFCVLHGVDLHSFNSMRIHSNAENFYLPYTTDGMVEVCRLFESINDFILIGKGSNTIFSKESYDVPVVCTNMLDICEISGKEFVVQGGVTLSRLAWFAQEKGVAGYEFLEDIPGSVGGALFMNAGTYEDTISQLVADVKIYDFSEKRAVRLTSDDLSQFWGKRKSYFQQTDCVVLECRLKADIIDDRTEILEKILKIKKERYLKQPREYPSAGSVFKRPKADSEQPVYVWKLLEEVGLRGYSVGGAQVSVKHPGFIVNTGNAVGKDFVDLLNLCKEKVKNEFGTELEEEWRIV